MISHVFAVLDAVICILVVLAALEFLRAIDAMHSPMLALSFYCVALGAFGLLIELMETHQSSPSSVALHFGVVLYAWAHRREIFTHDWHWDGIDRRKRG
ncbi:hypothetical protein [Pseudomonas knackmussii]|uniref:hypothetical protein n=1 Tax=Pseudomonas knackmussii TaxID=65741 RepID=UPI003F4A7FAA